MPPLSPAVELLQRYLRVPTALLPARCERWCKGSWMVPPDVMLHAEAILRASYTGAPAFAQSNQFLRYAVDLRDRNSFYECFAVLAGAWWSFDDQDSFYAELTACYTDSTLTTLLAGTTAVATLLGLGEGDDRGRLLLSYLSTSPALFTWSGIKRCWAQDPERLRRLMEKVLDAGQFVSHKLLGKMDAQLQKERRAPAAVAPAEQKAVEDAAADADEERKGGSAMDGEEHQGQDGEEQDSDPDDEQDSEQGDGYEEADSRRRAPRKRALGIDTCPRSAKRACPGSLAAFFGPSTPRVKAGFSFTEKGSAGHPWGWRSRFKGVVHAVEDALEHCPSQDQWLNMLRRLYRSEPNCWREFERRLVYLAKSHINPFGLVETFDSVVALCGALRSAHREPLRMWDLCCGAGGFSMAYHQALEEAHLCGDTTLAVDRDKRCIEVFGHNFPGVHTAVCDIHSDDWTAGSGPGAADLVCCGIPCPKWSRMQQARTGLTDDDPVHALIRLAKSEHSRPRAFLLECVDGMLTLHKEDFDHVVRQFVADAGYHFMAMVLNAADWGLPAERKRAYVVLFREKAELERFSPPEPPCPEQKTDFKSALLPETGIDVDDPAWIPHDEPHRYPGSRCGKGGDEPVSVRDPDRPGQMYNHDQQHTGESWRLKEGTAMCLLNSWNHPSNRPVVLDRERWRLLKSKELARMQGYPEWFRFPDLRRPEGRRERILELSGGPLPRTLAQENAECGLLGNSVAVPVVKSVIAAVLRAFIVPQVDDTGGLL